MRYRTIEKQNIRAPLANKSHSPYYLLFVGFAGESLPREARVCKRANTHERVRTLQVSLGCLSTSQCGRIFLCASFSPTLRRILRLLLPPPLLEFTFDRIEGTPSTWTTTSARNEPRASVMRGGRVSPSSPAISQGGSSLGGETAIGIRSVGCYRPGLKISGAIRARARIVGASEKHIVF